MTTATQPDRVTHDGRPIVKERQTKLGLYVTAKEAYDMWQADPEGVKILDVRTPEEWVFTGHAPMATLIPFAFLAYVWDEEKKGFTWSLNPDFVALVKERFSPEDTILVTCRSGGRGAMAINMLAAAGYTKAYNILDGMEGDGSRTPTACSTACAARTAGSCRACRGPMPSTPDDGAPEARGDREAPPGERRGLTDAEGRWRLRHRPHAEVTAMANGAAEKRSHVAIAGPSAAGRALRTPRSAALAGIAFSILFGIMLALTRLAVPSDPTDAGEWLSDSTRRDVVLFALGLVPFAGIAFLWFVGVPARPRGRVRGPDSSQRSSSAAPSCSWRCSSSPPQSQGG